MRMRTADTRRTASRMLSGTLDVGTVVAGMIWSPCGIVNGGKSAASHLRYMRCHSYSFYTPSVEQKIFRKFILEVSCITSPLRTLSQNKSPSICPYQQAEHSCNPCKQRVNDKSKASSIRKIKNREFRVDSAFNHHRGLSTPESGESLYCVNLTVVRRISRYNKPTFRIGSGLLSC